MFGKKKWKLAMIFTGTLIDDLMDAVERAEQKAQHDALLCDASADLSGEAWFASVQESNDYDSKFLGVA